MSSTFIKAVLVVEDNSGDARLLREMLNDEGWHDTEMTFATCMSEAETLLAQRTVDIILLDLGLPDVQGVAAVKRAHAAAPRVPLVVLTGSDDESLAAQALQDGAQDYLVKGHITSSNSGQVETRGLLRAMRYAKERKFMEDALYVEKERAEVTLNSIGDAVACTDTIGNLTFLNGVSEKLTGWSFLEAIGRPATEVFRILDGVNRQPIQNWMLLAAGKDEAMHLPSNSILVRRDGFESPVEDSVAPIHDREGKVTGAVIVFRDVSAARATALQITHLAEHDILTGLPNRVLLIDRISQAIALARRHKHGVMVLFLDLDGFKHINDSLGHSIGDTLLQSVANRLLGCVRDSDTVSRQGGDEFIVLLSEVEGPEHGAGTALRLLEAVADTHFIHQHDLHITTSIGVSLYPDDGIDAETLIKNADTAMYQAKENGRQSFQFFKPEMNVRAVERQSIEESLRHAMERQEFTLHYQPKIDLETGTISGAEALVRWTHPVRGLVSPAQFIPIAEACGLILPIGAWVRREACRQAKAWVDAGLSLTSIAVNVSAIEFQDKGFAENLFTILDETGFDPNSLELELTESVLMNGTESSTSILQALRAKGVQIAIDDFGTGYSSLSYLAKLPVDHLKIDQSFISRIKAGGNDMAIVIAVIALAKSLKLCVVAEGVETREELAFLQIHHCDEVQGYYFSRPIPAQQFGELLATGISKTDWMPFREVKSRISKRDARLRLARGASA